MAGDDALASRPPIEVPEELDEPNARWAAKISEFLAAHREGLSACMTRDVAAAGITLSFHIDARGRVRALVDDRDIERCMNAALARSRLEPAPGHVIMVRYPWR